MKISPWYFLKKRYNFDITKEILKKEVAHWLHWKLEDR